MKQSLTLLILPLLFLQLNAQSIQKLPDFGEVSRAELELEKCPFEENAPAMVLFDEGISVFRIYGNSLSYGVYRQTKHRVRIKIFSKKGFEYANVRIRYYAAGNIMGVTNLSAQTCNSDTAGNIKVEKVEKTSVYDHKINKRFSEKVFAFPAVKEGSIIEYEYTLDNVSERAWYFQKSIPVMFSRFTADFSPELVVGIVPKVSMPLSEHSNKKGVNNISAYTMEKIPSYTDEPFVSCAEDNLEQIQVKVTAADFRNMTGKNIVSSWPDIVKELMADGEFGAELRRNIPQTGELEKMLVAEKDVYRKLLIIYKYVRDIMVCDDPYGIWAVNGIRNAWKNKRGTGAEVNLILISLLRHAGISASPVLVSTRKNGLVNTEVPGYNQFDKVMAYAEIDDRFYVLDATDRLTPADMIPVEVLATEGLVIKPITADTYEYGWQYLDDYRHQYKSMAAIDAVIDEKHQMSGEAIVASAGYARLNMEALVKRGDALSKPGLVLQRGIIADSVIMTNIDVDTLPLEQKFRFSLPVSTAGDYHFFTVNFFSELEKNPFTADRRQSDIFYGYKQQYTINCAVSLPEGYELEALPQNLKVIMPDTSISFTRMSFYADRTLTVQMNLEFKKEVYPVSQYREIKESCKKIFGMLNEKYVYKKTKA